MALAPRSAEPLIEALAEILRTPAGSQPVESVGGPHPSRVSLSYSPKCVEGVFSEVRFTSRSTRR